MKKVWSAICLPDVPENDRATNVTNSINAKQAFCMEQQLLEILLYK
jgi:hypothetical protein